MRVPTDRYDGELEEVMKLLEQQDAQEAASAQLGQEPLPSKEALIKELMAQDENEVLSGKQAAMAEYSMMMKQWEALVEDYERRDAQEAAEAMAEQATQEEAD